MPHRVFLGLREVAGYFGNLQAGLEKLGVHAAFIDLSGDPYRYGRGRPPQLLGRLLAPATERPGVGTSHFRRWAWYARHAVRYAARFSLLLVAALRYDTFILGGSETFLPSHWELPVLKALHRRVIWVFLGSDHRPPYLGGRWIRTLTDDELGDLTGRLRRRVRRVERWDDVIVAPRPSAQFHRRPYVSFLAIGIPGMANVPNPTQSPDRVVGRVRVLHSPTDPVSKGTPLIRKCIERLIAAGLPIDYVEITGRPHAEVLAAIDACDLVIDEVFGDTPMGVLAMEAALSGKPTVVGGYYAALAPREIAKEDVPPSAFCLPSQLELAVEDLVRHADARRELGQRAATFVRARWSAEAVAGRYLRLMDGPPPRHWMVDADAEPYLHGWGIGEEALRQALARLIRQYGPAFLQVDDLPMVRSALLEFAAGSDQPDARNAGNAGGRPEIVGNGVKRDAKTTRRRA